MSVERRTGKKTMKALFLDQARRGRVRPLATSNDYHALRYYCKTDPEFVLALTIANPLWPVKFEAPGRRKGNREESTK